MPLHKYMIEHLLYPAMEQHKGNQIRAILNELQLSQKANAPAVQYQRLITANSTFQPTPVCCRTTA